MACLKPLEERIAAATGIVGAAWTLAAALWVSPGAGVAVALGTGLSLLNFLWLKAGVGALLQAARGGAVVMGGLLRFLLRFGLLGLCLCAIFISHLVPFAWVWAGLFAVPAATLLIGVGQVIRVR